MQLRRLLAVLAVLGAFAVSTVAVAGAATAPPSPGPFSISPTSGPVGTSIAGTQDIPFGFARANCVDWFFTLGSDGSSHDGNSQGPTRTGSLQVAPGTTPATYAVIAYCVDLKNGTSQVGTAAFTVTGPETDDHDVNEHDDHDCHHDDGDDDDDGGDHHDRQADHHDRQGDHDHRQGAHDHHQGDDDRADHHCRRLPPHPPRRPRRPRPRSRQRLQHRAGPLPSSRAPSRSTSPSVAPGGDVNATGTGCDPGATVTLEIAGEQVGETTADSDGSFSTPIDVPDVDPGRLEVIAHCGPVLTTTPRHRARLVGDRWTVDPARDRDLRCCCSSACSGTGCRHDAS